MEKKEKTEEVKDEEKKNKGKHIINIYENIWSREKYTPPTKNWGDQCPALFLPVYFVIVLSNLP